MANKILIIDADRAFARDLSNALQARRVETRLSDDGQSGLEEVRSWHPDLVVLCVELPNLSGYSVCNKLKRDEQLRSIPLILTSAEATPETFDHHRKLRTRAEEYLLKPFEPAVLVRTIAKLIELPPEGPGGQAQPQFGSSEDLELIDRVFDELSTGGVGDAGAPEGPVDVATTRVAARDPGRSTTAPETRPAGELERTRARMTELETEIGRLEQELRDANEERARLSALERSMQEAIESSRAAVERANAAEARLGTIEARLRHADALRDKARRALAVVLQALEEPAQRASPSETPPRRE